MFRRQQSSCARRVVGARRICYYNLYNFILCKRRRRRPRHIYNMFIIDIDSLVKGRSLLPPSAPRRRQSVYVYAKGGSDDGTRFRHSYVVYVMLYIRARMYVFYILCYHIPGAT